uniref:Uncharacterized protein n=1 Tax=Ovis aries TaxID=9940 RepID=A0AC11EU18_SHEEP
QGRPPPSTHTNPAYVNGGSRRRRLVLRLSQKDALQALFQQNPYPGIATRERLVWGLPSPAHRLGRLGREARRKRTVVSPSQTSILVQAFRRDRSLPGIAAREELARQTGIPEPRIQVSPPASARAQESGGLSPAERLELDTRRPGPGPGAAAWGRGSRRAEWRVWGRLWPVRATPSSAPQQSPRRARRRSSHDSSCSRGPKDPTRGPEHLSSPPPPATGEHATLGGPSCSVWGPRLLGARDCPWGLCGPALDDLHGPAQPGGSLAKWEATTSCPGSRSLGRELPTARPSGSLGKGPSCRLHSRRHTSRAGRGHPYGEGAAPPLEPQPQPAAFQARRASSAGSWRRAAPRCRPWTLPGAFSPRGRCDGVDPALPGAPSLLDELLAAAGAPASPGPSRGPLPSRCNRQLSLAHPAS